MTGNLKPAFCKTVKNNDISTKGFIRSLKDEGFLAGGETRHWLHDISPSKEKHRPYILESYFYADEVTEKLLPMFGDFLLDSGAFTFMQNSKSHVEWDEYIERYADFISRNNIEKFFELDIDSVVGYKEVLRFRKNLKN